MTYAYRCPMVGLECADGPGRVRCPACGKMHRAYQTGAPPMEAGAPFTRNDHLKPHWDWGAGRRFNSKSQREAWCKANGMVLRSYDEYARHSDHDIRKPAEPRGFTQKDSM